MDELMGPEAGLLDELSIEQHKNTWAAPIRGSKSYTIVLEFFVKTVKINMSFN